MGSGSEETWREREQREEWERKERDRKFTKKLMSFVILAIIIVLLSIMLPMSCTRIEPGHVGIKVVYGGGDRGVQDFPARTGWVFYVPFLSTVMEYPTSMQVASWTKTSEEGGAANEEITFNTKEGLVVSGDISLGYQLMATKVPYFYIKFRNDDLDQFTHGYLRNVARDAFNEIGSRYNVEDVYGAKKEELLREVVAYIRKEVSPFGVDIQQFGFIGALRIPQNVKAALDAKIQATQDAIRAENQIRQAEAEAQKVIAEARGKAESNRLLNQSITPTLIEWERLQIAKHTVWKWNGVRPQVEGNANLLFSLPTHK